MGTTKYIKLVKSEFRKNGILDRAFIREFNRVIKHEHPADAENFQIVFGTPQEVVKSYLDNYGASKKINANALRPFIVLIVISLFLGFFLYYQNSLHQFVNREIINDKGERK